MVISIIIVALCVAFLLWLFVGREFGGFGVVWAFWATLYLSILGGIIYVAVHFISKYW